MATFLGIFFLIVCVLLIVVVLLQKGRGGGLGAAFGGGAGSSAFGTRTGDVFTWVTIVLTAMFLLIAIGATLAYRPDTIKLDTPVATPAQWPTTEAGDRLAVKLDTPGMGGTEIHYTLDGSEPTKESPTAKGDFFVEKGDTLKARAFRSGMEPSETLVIEYAPKPEAEATSSDEQAAPTETPAEKPERTPADEATPAEPTESPATDAKGE